MSLNRRGFFGFIAALFAARAIPDAPYVPSRPRLTVYPISEPVRGFRISELEDYPSWDALDCVDLQTTRTSTMTLDGSCIVLSGDKSWRYDKNGGVTLIGSNRDNKPT